MESLLVNLFHATHEIHERQLINALSHQSVQECRGEFTSPIHFPRLLLGTTSSNEYVRSRLWVQKWYRFIEVTEILLIYSTRKAPLEFFSTFSIFAWSTDTGRGMTTVKNDGLK